MLNVREMFPTAGLIPGADDTAALNAALAACGSGLYLPAGDYGISGDLLIRRSNARLVGDGVGATTLRARTNWQVPAVGGSVPSMVQLLAQDWTSANHNPLANVALDGISFVGIAQSSGPNDPKAIAGCDASDVRIRDCSFEGLSHETIWPNGPTCERWRIEDNDFTHCGHDGATLGVPSTISVNGRDTLIARNTFRDCYYPIGVAYGPAVVSDNVIRDHLGAGISIGEFAADDVVVRGNVVSGLVSSSATHSGIRLGTVSSGVLVSGNVVRLRMAAGAGQATGILVSGSGGVKGGQLVADNLVTLDMDGLPIPMLGIGVQGAGTVVTLRGNEVLVVNEGAAYHTAIQATAKAGETLRTVIQHNRALGFTRDSNSGYAFDLSRSGTGVHVLEARCNFSDEGYHRYDGVLYATGLDSRAVSFCPAVGLVVS